MQRVQRSGLAELAVDDGEELNRQAEAVERRETLERLHA
jgi:hypothetical protein